MHLNQQPAHTHFLATFASRALCFSVYWRTLVLEATHRRLFGFIPKDTVLREHASCNSLTSGRNSLRTRVA